MTNHSELDAAIAALGLEYKVVFIPQSASRNSGEKNPSLNWRVSLTRSVPGYSPANFPTIETDYMQGIGHVPEPEDELFKRYGRRGCIGRDRYEREVAETGKYGGDFRGSHVRLPLSPPPLADVLYSLILDSDATDYSFEEWCDNYGYDTDTDTDSRKAESTYNACRDIGYKLRCMIGADTIAQLRELFSDY